MLRDVEDRESIFEIMFWNGRQNGLSAGILVSAGMEEHFCSFKDAEDIGSILEIYIFNLLKHVGDDRM